MPRQTSRSALQVRNATLADIPGIVALSAKVYPAMGAYPEGMIQGQLVNFPEGQFVVEYEGDVVGYAASFIIDEAAALAPHTWDEITGNGYASRHNPKGDWLYGMEICVDPERRRLRIGQRLYDARRELAERLELKGIVFGGRMPHWKRRRKQYATPNAYLEAVLAQEVSDPVIRFQTRMGFEPIGVLEGYLPSDHESGGYATHMVWHNPYAIEQTKSDSAPPGSKDVVRVATVQFQQRRVSSFEEFISNIEYFVSVTSDYRSDFVVFPELFTLQLLALEETRLTHAQSIERLTEYTPRFVEEMRQLAISYNINIIGGSHPTRTDDGDIQNVAYVFLRDGSVHAQEKIHPTPSERHWWNIKGGDQISTIQTDCGPVGILICYDSEFPELARRLADEGAENFLRAVLHRQPPGLYARALLFPGTGDREPVLCGDVRQCGKSARCGKHGYPVCPLMHPHALRFRLRPGRDRRGMLGEWSRPCRSRISTSPISTGRDWKARCAISGTGASTSTP